MNEVGEEERKRKKKIGRKSSSNGEKENVVEGKGKVGGASRAKKRRIRKLRTNEESGPKQNSLHVSNEVQSKSDLGVERTEKGDKKKDGRVLEGTGIVGVKRIKEEEKENRKIPVKDIGVRGKEGDKGSKEVGEVEKGRVLPDLPKEKPARIDKKEVEGAEREKEADKRVEVKKEEDLGERISNKGVEVVVCGKEGDSEGSLLHSHIGSDLGQARKEGKRMEEKMSREEVLAMREAKKKAKQEARNKKPNQVKVERVGEKGDEKEKPVQPQGVNSKESLLKEISQVKTELRLDPKKPENVEEAQKSKGQLKAERRAKQEAQRAAKEAEKQGKEKARPEDIKPAQKKPSAPSQLSPRTSTKEKKSLISSKLNINRVKLFSHLHFETRPFSTQINLKIHPAVIRLGTKYETRVVNGSNARCIAFLQALKKVISDYETPLEEELGRGLEGCLSRGMDYLQGCRPVSVSMTNALRHIKSHLTQLPNNISDAEAKGKLCDVIDTYIHDQIEVAGVAICNAVQKKISDGDQILIYACSSVVLRLLVESHKEGTKFSCVVVDGGPGYEGRQMLRRLVEEGITTSYVLINAVSFIMRQASKVLLGAHALLANGYVMSRAGSSLIALMANSYNVPVLVCCETYKFCERVQTDAFVYNELGNPEEVVEESQVASECRGTSQVSLLSLMYDITPPDLVTAVVTELAILPCTSVPVILRIKPSDLAT